MAQRYSPELREIVLQDVADGLTHSEIIRLRGITESQLLRWIALDRVRTAISQIELGGQAVEFEGQTLTRADLRTLYQREAKLQRSETRARRGGIRVMRVTPK